MVIVAEFPFGKSTVCPPDARIVIVQRMVSSASLMLSSSVGTKTVLEVSVIPAGNERVTGVGLVKSPGSVCVERREKERERERKREKERERERKREKESE